MTKKYCTSTLLFIIIALGSVLLGSCEQLHIGIGYIKNNTKSDLAGANWDKVMADSVLCNDKVYLNAYIQPGLSQSLTTKHYRRELSELPDTAVEYIYIFNLDTLTKYQKLKLCNGIVKRCLVKRIAIQLNKVKAPLDTVFIQSAEPIRK